MGKTCAPCGPRGSCAPRKTGNAGAKTKAKVSARPKAKPKAKASSLTSKKLPNPRSIKSGGSPTTGTRPRAPHQPPFKQVVITKPKYKSGPVRQVSFMARTKTTGGGGLPKKYTNRSNPKPF